MVMMNDDYNNYSNYNNTTLYKLQYQSSYLILSHSSPGLSTICYMPWGMWNMPTASDKLLCLLRFVT